MAIRTDEEFGRVNDDHQLQTTGKAVSDVELSSFAGFPSFVGSLVGLVGTKRLGAISAISLTVCDPKEAGRGRPPLLGRATVGTDALLLGVSVATAGLGTRRDVHPAVALP